MERFEVVKDVCRKHPDEEIKLPTKGTRYSAGYDFYSNESVMISPQETYPFHTDIKVKLEKDEFLMIVPRSSIGIKKHLMLMNTVAIIDSDYYNNEDNDGNIILALYNYYNYGVSWIENGERIAQGIVCKYVNSTEDLSHSTTKKRKGGIGSTGK